MSHLPGNKALKYMFPFKDVNTTVIFSTMKAIDEEEEMQR